MVEDAHLFVTNCAASVSGGTENFMKRTFSVIFTIFTIFILFWGICVLKNEKKEVVEINVGYQRITSQLWSALVIKSEKMFEDKLQMKFPDKEIRVNWYDNVSGANINSSMISGKIDIGFLGDMPCLINGYYSYTNNDYHSYYIACDGRGKEGANQDVVVPYDSTIRCVDDLLGKDISVPIGSSAHRMLLMVLEKNKMINKVRIVHQDLSAAETLLETGKIDAISVWEPYSSYLEDKGAGRVIINGEESNVDYVTGIVASEEMLKNTEIINIFFECLEETHLLLSKSPEFAAKLCEKESGFPYKVCVNVIKNTKWNSKLKEEDIKIFEKNMDFLQELGTINKYDISDFFSCRKK